MGPRGGQGGPKGVILDHFGPHLRDFGTHLEGLWGLSGIFGLQLASGGLDDVILVIFSYKRTGLQRLRGNSSQFIPRRSNSSQFIPCLPNSSTLSLLRPSSSQPARPLSFGHSGSARKLIPPARYRLDTRCPRGNSSQFIPRRPKSPQFLPWFPKLSTILFLRAIRSNPRRNTLAFVPA